MHAQHRHAAAHVLQASIGFEPAQGATDLTRQLPTAAVGALLDQGADHRHVDLAEGPSAVAFHEVLKVIDGIGSGERKTARRCALTCQGRKWDKSAGAFPPPSAQACRYSVSQRRGLIFQHCTSVMSTVNTPAAN